ncbi:hypothetical protein KQI84_11595 [bacterium]|nr:hypothetical protein [bacterium]
MRIGRWLFIGILLSASLLAGGCGSVPAPTHVVKLAVLDGVMAENATETRQELTGWWLSSRDRYQNGNAGIQLGEALADEFEKIPGVLVYPRTDLATYMAQKERTVRRAYPDLSPEERLVVLQSQHPLDYGRSLNVDYVLSSHVALARTTHQRTFHWWVSRIRFDLDLWDVEQGQKIWTWHGEDSDLFDSQLTVIEELAEEAREEAYDRDIFRLY